MLSLRARIRPTLVAPSQRCCFRSMGSLSQAHQVPHSVDEECSHLLPWLRQNAGSEITSHLTIGKSVHGRSLFASKPIQAGDCILKIPKSVHLTADNLHPSVSSLLGEDANDDMKLALVVLLHQKLGQASQWAPYISCLPRVEEMHSTIFWSDEELEMIKTSSLYNETLESKAQIEEEFLYIKHVLDRFPEYFEDVTLRKYMHAVSLVMSRAWSGRRGGSMIPFADFFNHDTDSQTRISNDEVAQVSKVIAGENYAPGDEVLISYSDIPNAQLLLKFGFLVPFSQNDMVEVEIIEPQHDHLRAMKLDLLDRHTIPALMGVDGPHSYGNSFIVRNVKSSCVQGRGIPTLLRAFARVVCCTSPQELQELATEATQNDGRLAKIPLKNKEREMEAHRFLHLRFDDMIENHTAALESLTRAASPTLSGKCTRRMQLARDLLTSDLQTLKSVSAWLKNYCETLKV